MAGRKSALRKPAKKTAAETAPVKKSLPDAKKKLKRGSAPRKPTSKTAAKKAPVKKSLPAPKKTTRGRLDGPGRQHEPPGTGPPGPAGGKAANAGSNPAPAPKKMEKSAAPAQAKPTTTTNRLLQTRVKADMAQLKEAPLTLSEEAFLTEYLRNGMNGTAAWMFSHPGCGPASAAVSASQTIRRPKISARLQAERERMSRKHEIDRDGVLLEFLRIVRADPNELTQMRCLACDACWGGERGPAMYVDPDPDCPRCAGEGAPVPWYADTRRLSPEARALYAGVKTTKDGAQVLMHDKVAALVNVGKILGAYEADNRQKDQNSADALREFFAGMHGNRLPIARGAPKQSPGPAANPLVKS